MQIAAIFAFATAAFFLLQDGPTKSGSELFASHFELPVPINERSTTDPSEIWNEAMIAYTNEDFKKTVGLLITTVDQADFRFVDPGKLYLGVSYLMENDFENAVKRLEQVSMESSYFQQAEWYLALTFLKMENVEEAKRAFQKITDQKRHFKKAEALEILENL